jgi:hypothetical protein
VEASLSRCSKERCVAAAETYAYLSLNQNTKANHRDSKKPSCLQRQVLQADTVFPSDTCKQKNFEAKKLWWEAAHSMLGTNQTM